MDIALSISPRAWNICTRSLGDENSRVDCRLEGSFWDEDKDGNISLEFRIVNEYDYILKNVTLNIEKCSSAEVKFNSIESNGTVYVKIDDVCIYDKDRNFFVSNSYFAYYNENDTLKSYNNHFSFPVYIKLTESKGKNFTLGKIIIPVLIFFIFLFCIIKFKKWRGK